MTDATDERSSRDKKEVDGNTELTGGIVDDTDHAVVEASPSGERANGRDGSSGDGRTRTRITAFVVFLLLPLLAIATAGLVGYLKWWSGQYDASRVAAVESVEAATTSAVAMLSYNPDDVDIALGAARKRLTGDLQGTYTKLIHDSVIPAAKQQHITSVVTVQAAASVSASPTDAIALVFLNQSTTVGDTPPTDSVSAVRVVLQRIDGQWLVSGFTPE